MSEMSGDVQQGLVLQTRSSPHYTVTLICISALVFGNNSKPFFATIHKTETLTCAGKSEFGSPSVNSLPFSRGAGGGYACSLISKITDIHDFPHPLTAEQN